MSFTQHAGGEARTGRFETGAAGPILLLAAAAAAVVVFWFGLSSLVDAWSTPEYSHGPIIPLISTFLFLREMRDVPPSDAPVRDRWPGIALIGAGLAVGVLGNLANIDNIVTYGFMVWVAGVVLICFGLRRGLMFWPAIVHLVFMLPLPQFLYWEVSSYLQTVSSQIGVWLISAVGISVYLDGNIIDLGVYKLQVAEACSGLRYLFPMLSFSYVFAVLYDGPRWHKVLLLAMAAPITVAMNSFRIGMIGVLVDNFGISHAEGFLHAFEGWVIFVACVLILFGTAMLLQLTTARPRRLSETLDISFEGLGDQLARFRRVPASGALAAAAGLTFALALAWNAAPSRETVTPSRDPFVLFPMTIGDWRGVQGAQLDRAIEQVLGADDYFSAGYASPSEPAPVDLFMAYYFDQTDGSGIHSPEVCIPAGGWEVSAWRTITIPDTPLGPIEANRAIIQKGMTRQLVYFWFDLRGRRIAGDYEAKFVNMWDSIVDGRSDGALVRLITPIGHHEAVEDADARLRRFMSAALPVAPSFIPE